ncbi:MAG TPA: hypothetical protein VGS04_06305 [Nitrososphaerales archaeon]|nr:hypothetical protein [Nitrososphaerales archaeon]
MATSEGELRRNADLKLWMETRIGELQEEIDRLKEALAVIDSVLRASSFKPAAALASAGPRPAISESEELTGEPIPEIRELKKDRGGETIAVAQLTKQKLKIEPVAEVTLKPDTPPFKSFLLGKILSGMKSADEDSVAKGRLKKGEELRYTLSEKNGRISALVIENYREKERMTEILNTVSWTFSRMLEK